jgi:hypothetical protein
MPKLKKAGRPKLPKGEAMGRVVQVRFTAQDTKAIEAAAKASDQTVSDWIRSIVNTHFRAYCPVCELNVTASIALNRADLVEALERDTEVPLVHAFPLTPDHKFLATKEQKELMRKRAANGSF